MARILFTIFLMFMSIHFIEGKRAANLFSNVTETEVDGKVLDTNPDAYQLQITFINQLLSDVHLDRTRYATCIVDVSDKPTIPMLGEYTVRTNEKACTQYFLHFRKKSRYRRLTFEFSTKESKHNYVFDYHTFFWYYDFTHPKKSRRTCSARAETYIYYFDKIQIMTEVHSCGDVTVKGKKTILVRATFKYQGGPKALLQPINSVMKTIQKTDAYIHVTNKRDDYITLSDSWSFCYDVGDLGGKGTKIDPGQTKTAHVSSTAGGQCAKEDGAWIYFYINQQGGGAKMWGMAMIKTRVQLEGTDPKQRRCLIGSGRTPMNEVTKGDYLYWDAGVAYCSVGGSHKTADEYWITVWATH